MFIGELADFGNHVLLPEGVTLCGLPTVDANMERFPQLKDAAFADMLNEYTVKEWDVTCEKCLEVFDIVQAANEKRKAENN